MLLNTIIEDKKYFLINQEIFAEDVSGNAKLVYMYLVKCADAMGKSWPSHADIARKCSMSISAVKTAIKELLSMDLIKSFNRFREGGGKSSNMYMLTNKKYTTVFPADPAIFFAQISAKAKLIYLYFCRCADRIQSTCFPSHRDTADKCAAGMSTVRKAIKELAELGLIACQARTRKNNGQTSNLYTVFCAIVNKVNGNDQSGDEKPAAGQNRPSAACDSDSGIAAVVPEENGKGSVLNWLRYLYNSRGHRQISAREVLSYNDERTTPTLNLSRRK